MIMSLYIYIYTGFGCVQNSNMILIERKNNEYNIQLSDFI